MNFFGQIRYMTPLLRGSQRSQNQRKSGGCWRLGEAGISWVWAFAGEDEKAVATAVQECERT